MSTKVADYDLYAPPPAAAEDEVGLAMQISARFGRWPICFMLLSLSVAKAEQRAL